MATLTITVPNDQVPRVLNAFTAIFGGPEGGETAAEFMERQIVNYMKAQMARVELQEYTDDFDFEDPGIEGT